MQKNSDIRREKKTALIKATLDSISALRNLYKDIEEATRIAQILYNITGKRILAMTHESTYHRPYLVVMPDGIKIAIYGNIDEDPIFFNYKYEELSMGPERIDQKRRFIDLSTLEVMAHIGLPDIPVFLDKSENTYQHVATAVIEIVADWPTLEKALTAEIEAL